MKNKEEEENENLVIIKSYYEDSELEEDDIKHYIEVSHLDWLSNGDNFIFVNDLTRVLRKEETYVVLIKDFGENKDDYDAQEAAINFL